MERIRAPDLATEFASVEEKAKVENEIRQTRRKTKTFQALLNSSGRKAGVAPSKKERRQQKVVHLDVYTRELKTLIGKLNDDTLDAVQANSKNKIKKHAHAPLLPTVEDENN